MEYEGSIINSKLIPSYELVKQLALLFQLCWTSSYVSSTGFLSEVTYFCHPFFCCIMIISLVVLLCCLEMLERWW